MKSTTIDAFWKCYSELPEHIKKQTKEAYKRFISNPYHTSLYFKRIHSERPVFSIRITKDYRSVGVLRDNEIIWFWIGSHSEYDKLLKQFKNT